MMNDGRQRLHSLVPGLDTITAGGLLSGSVYLISGTPGSGKTTLANQICFSAAAQGQHSLYVTLISEAHDRIIENLQSFSFYSPERASNVRYISGFDILEHEGLEGLLRLIAAEARLCDAKTIVLEAFFALRDVASSDAALRRFISDLQSMAYLTGAIVVLVTNEGGHSACVEFAMADGWIEMAATRRRYRAMRFVQIHKLRGSSFIEGRHALIFGEAGVHILPRLESIRFSPEEELEAAKLSTGIKGLDEMLEGGLEFGSSALVIGPTGVGKTALGLHFVGQSTKEEPGLFFGFYERTKELRRKSKELRADGFEAGIEAGYITHIWHSPRDYLIDELGYELVNAVRRQGVKRVFVDSANVFGQSAYYPERITQFLAGLTRMLREEGVTALFSLETAELEGGENRVQLSTMSAIAQTIVIMRYAQLSDEVVKTVSVVKARSADFDRRVRALKIDRSGVTIAEPLILKPQSHSGD